MAPREVLSVMPPVCGTPPTSLWTATFWQLLILVSDTSAPAPSTPLTVKLVALTTIEVLAISPAERTTMASVPAACAT